MPTKVAPTHTIVEKKPQIPKQQSKVINPRTHKVQLRNLEDIKNSGAYEKSDYKPTPQRAITDQDKEHLGKIMAFGKDYDKWPKNIVQEEEEEPNEPEMDRFDECKTKSINIQRIFRIFVNQLTIFCVTNSAN